VKRALLVFLLGPVLGFGQARPATTAGLLVLTHVTVIDATGSPPKPDMSVEVRNHRIVAMSRTGQAPPSADARVVDATGRFLIPGLWDMHVHTGQRDIYLPLYIANGVTGVRDMGGDLEEPTGDLSARYVQLRLWREAIEEGSLLGPRIVVAGFLVDGVAWPGNVRAANAVEGQQAVDVLKRLGVDFIKVKSFLSREAYFAIAAEARSQGLALAGHVPGSVRAAEASDAGHKSVEHLTGVSLGCSAAEGQLMEEMAAAFAARDRARYARAESRAVATFDALRAAALFARFVKNGTWQVPTLVELRRNALGGSSDETPAAGRKSDPRWTYLPASLRERWEQERASPADPAGPALFASEIALVRGMHAAGVPFMAGTDSANPSVLPGFSLHDELKLLVAAGFSPMEALQAATLNPARYLGRQREGGTIEVGKLADLILLGADPLADISNTRKIDAVIVNGRYLARADLDAMLSRVEAEAR